MPGVLLVLSCARAGNVDPEATRSAEVREDPARPPATVVHSSAVGEACAPPTQPGLSQRLILNEWMAFPGPDGSAAGQWFELYNPTKTTVTATGWRLRTASGFDVAIGPLGDGTTPITVAGDRYLVLCSDAAVFSAAFADAGCTWAWGIGSGSAMASGGDTIELIEADGTTIADRVTWTNAAPTGRSISLRSPYLAHGAVACPVAPASPDDPAAWVDEDGQPLPFGAASAGAADKDKGTPGFRNSDVWYEAPTTCTAINLCNPCRCIREVCMAYVVPGCCFLNSHCVDECLCTKDTCDLATHTCVHTPIEGTCVQDSNCIDDDPCTVGRCPILPGTVSGICEFAVPEGSACCWLDPSLDPATGAAWDPSVADDARETALQAAADEQCRDRNRDACLVEPVCHRDRNECTFTRLTPCCSSDTACDDGNPCTTEQCDATTGTCSATPIAGCCLGNEECDDGEYCTRDTCGYLHSCAHAVDHSRCCNPPVEINPSTGIPWGSEAERQAWADRQCDDHDPATVGMCDLTDFHCSFRIPEDPDEPQAEAVEAAEIAETIGDASDAETDAAEPGPDAPVSRDAGEDPDGTAGREVPAGDDTPTLLDAPPIAGDWPSVHSGGAGCSSGRTPGGSGAPIAMLVLAPIVVLAIAIRRRCAQDLRSP